MQNKPSRIERMIKILKALSLSPSEAAQVHGLLNFAGGFVVGRALKTSCKSFSNLTQGCNDKTQVVEITSKTIELLQAMRPRLLKPLSLSKPTRETGVVFCG